LHDVEHSGLVAQVNLFEAILRMRAHRFEIGEVAGVGETVEVDESFDFGPVNDVLNEVGADEAGTAGDEKFHGESQLCDGSLSQGSSTKSNEALPQTDEM
jgi:hypothetical protein